MGLHVTQASKGHLNVAGAAPPPMNEVLRQALDGCREAAGLIGEFFGQRWRGRSCWACTGRQVSLAPLALSAGMQRRL